MSFLATKHALEGRSFLFLEGGCELLGLSLHTAGWFTAHEEIGEVVGLRAGGVDCFAGLVALLHDFATSRVVFTSGIKL